MVLIMTQDKQILFNHLVTYALIDLADSYNITLNNTEDIICLLCRIIGDLTND